MAGEAAGARPDIVAVVIDGVGNGHGRGMSQWGAYGWAVDQRKAWQWILDHYYGGTVLGDVATGQAGSGCGCSGSTAPSTVGVIAGSGTVAAAGNTGARCTPGEISANRFEIYGSTSPACPSASSLVVPNGPIPRVRATATRVRQIQTVPEHIPGSGDTHSSSTVTSAT